MSTRRRWTTGEAVRITCADESVIGVVQLASENGRSLALVFDGLLAGHAGMMPVLWDDKAEVFRTITCGSVVGITPAKREPRH